MPDQVTFNATLQDNVTPNLQKLEKQLTQMGMSPVQIQMTLNAVDQATPKIKEAQKHMNLLPKIHTINIDVKSGINKAREEMSRFREEATKPITMPFRLVDEDGNKLSDTMTKLFNVRSKVALPLAGSLPGSNLLYGVGMGAGIAGAVTGVSGAFQQSFKLNSEDEQALEKLTVALRTNAGATQDLNKVIAASAKTPFSFQQNLQADVLGRSFQMPMFAGENRSVPGGYLQVAGNMAAAMGQTPDDAMMALAMARQHQYRRMQMYGVHMQASDFGPGGRFAGENVDQALGQATKRFQGAMSAQMGTFQGMMSNIHDVLQQQFLKPIGQNIFDTVKERAGGVESFLGSAGGEARIGKLVEQIQHFTVTVINDLEKVKEYFDTHLKQPIENVISGLSTLSKSFGQAFGATTVTALKTFSDALLGISGPMSSLVKDVPMIGTLAGYMKGMQVLGLGGTVKPLQTLGNAINPMNQQGMFTGMGHAILQLPGMAMKTGGFLIVKEILDANRAAADMNNQFKNAKSELDHINDRASTLAMSLGTSATNMKNLVAQAAQGIPTGAVSPRARANLALGLGAAGVQIGRLSGGEVTGQDAIRAIEAEMKQTHDYTTGAMKEFGTEVLQAAAVAKQFGNSWSQVQQIITTFKGAAEPIGLGGMQGAPSLIALSNAVNRYGITPGQQSQGWYTPDALLNAMMGDYRTPSVEQVTTARQSRGGLGAFWNFRGTPGALARYGSDSSVFTQQAAQGAALQGTARAQIGQLAPSAISGAYSMPMIPNIWQHPQYAAGQAAGPSLGVNFGQFGVGRGQSPEQAATKLSQAWATTATNVAKAQQALTNWGATVEQTQSKIDQLNQAQSSVNLQMQAFQQQITIQQRKVEDASLTLQEYTYKNLRPLEEELTRVQNTMDKVNHTMSDAQYNMSKFADGLLTGEQAALDQLHALSLYNEQLNYLKMQYTQIGAQLGTQVYERGYSARVGPLMGLSLEMQMQQMQRRQQMAQAQYDITYGEGHYQMQQAQRSRFQRTELPLNERLTNIRQAQSQIDNATVAQHKLADVQFDLQQKMFPVNQAIQKQNDHLQELQMNVTKMQQSGYMRHLQTEQYNLGQAIGAANIELNNQNNILSQWQNTVDNLKIQQQDIEKLFDTMLVFKGGSGQYAQDRRMIHFAQQTGMISPQEAKSLTNAVNQAQRTATQAGQQDDGWYRKRGSAKQVIIDALIGFFTGDLWRKLADMVRGMPMVGGVASTALSAAGTIVPIVTAVSTALIMGGTASWLMGRAASAVLTRIPGADRVANVVGGGARLLPGRLGGKLAGVTDAEGLASAIRKSLPEAIAEKFAFIRHPLEEIRVNLFRALGAGIGTAVGGPGGGLLGGWLGGKLGKSTEVREVVQAGHEIKKGAGEILATPGKLGRHIKDFGSHVGEQAKDFKVVIHGQEVNLSTAKKIVKEDLGGKVAQFGEEIGERKGFGKWVGLIGGHVGRFGRFVGRLGAIVTAVELFKTVIESFKGWFGTLVSHLHIPGASAAPKVGVAAEDTSRAARDVATRARGLYESNATFRSTVDAARKAGAVGFKWGGRLLKFGAGVGAATSFIPMVGDFAKGDIAQGVGSGTNAATYLLPGVGEARAFTDLLHSLGVVPGMDQAYNTRGPGGVYAPGPAGNIQKKVTDWLGITHPGSGYNPGGTFVGPRPGRGISTSGPASGSISLADSYAPGGSFTYSSAEGAQGGNYYSDSIQILENYLANNKKINKSKREEINALISQYRQKETLIDKQYNQLNLKQLTQYTNLSAQQQLQAQEAAVNGPNGLVNYLKSVNSHLDNHWNTRLQALGTNYGKENDVHNAGYKAISGTTGSWLDALTRQIQNWAKQNGVPLTQSKAQSVGQAVIQGTKAATNTGTNIFNAFGSAFAHGGMVHLDKHEQLGHGKTVRMVEEGHPEMVIPFAPHRRDRAKKLVRQAHSMLGMAGGGYVYPFGGPVNWGRTDMGVDFSMAPGTPIAAIGNAKIQGINQNWYAGQPYMWYQLTDGPESGRYIYVAEQINPEVRAGQLVKAGQEIAKYAGSGTGIEMGWGTSGWQTLQQATMPGASDSATNIGNSFRTFVQGLQHGKILGAGALGMGGQASIKPIHLKDPPASQFYGRGVAGHVQLRILQRAKQTWEKFLNSQGGTGGAGHITDQKGPQVAHGWTLAAMKLAGVSGNDWLNMLLRQESRESGFDPNSINLWDSNAKAGHPSKGILQTIDSTFNQYKVPGHSNIWNPVDNIAAAIRYMISAYGHGDSATALSAMIARGGGGYVGGIRRVPHDNMAAVLHKDEMVVPAAMAHAARAQAGLGHATPSLRGLRDDEGWVSYTRDFTKHLTSIQLIQTDIHKLRQHFQNEPVKVGSTLSDTQLLQHLNSGIRNRQGQRRTFHATPGNIPQLLAAIGDPSGGESTLAGVSHEKALRAASIYTAVHSSPALTRAHNKLTRDQGTLHKAQHNLTKLQHTIHNQHHHATKAQTRELHAIQGNIRKDQHRVTLDKRSISSIEKALKAHTKQNEKIGSARYIVSAATRGVNAALMKSITGHGLNQQQSKAYVKLEQATAHGAKLNSKHIQDLKSQLTKTLLDTHKQATKQAAASHGDNNVHNKKHENHMNKTEKHQNKLETQMEALLKKPTTVNIVNQIQGTHVTTRRVPTRVRSR